MKTIISIPLILLILFSGISVKFATHYCGGYFVASKVSLTGELATCGMEKPATGNSSQNTYNNKCCEDVISAYSICNNYLSSSYLVNEPVQPVFHMIYIPVDFLNSQKLSIYCSNNCIRPPGAFSPNNVVRAAICIFRI